MNTPRVDPWVLFPERRARAQVRLFCLPYAGSGASPFRAWAGALPSGIELCPIQLPGREERLAERPFERLAPLVEALADAVYSHLDRPFALFGHSMGALLAFELARSLRRPGAGQPLRHLFVSAYRAPHLPDPDPPLHRVHGSAFWDELRRLNGTPKEVLDNDDLKRLVEPTLRADFAVHETYVHAAGEPLTCPLSAFGGFDDLEVSRDMLEEWRRHTRGSFRLRMLPGDHFFIHPSRDGLLEAIAGDLAVAPA
jgi:medium-chain acyl-[acyl-carrier-protein] hydrolase